MTLVFAKVSSVVGHKDLDDVGKLEEYIAESAVILIFYSKKDFRSIYAPVALEKHFIAVCEVDDNAMDTKNKFGFKN